TGQRRVMSRQLHFVEIDGRGRARGAGYAPYLDYRPISPEERALAEPSLQAGWLSADLEAQALGFAIAHLVPPHLEEVRQRKMNRTARTRAAVKERLTKEINYWDRRANALKAQERAGKPNARINSGKARERADELQRRMHARLEELDQEGRLS